MISGTRLRTYYIRMSRMSAERTKPTYSITGQMSGFAQRRQRSNSVLLRHMFCVARYFQLVEGLKHSIRYLHLGLESKPRWNLMMFLFMVLLIFVLVGGSMWIMYNLNYNVMPS